MLYALVVVSVFVWVGVYRRLHDMEARFVALSRKIALDGSPQDSYTAGSSTAGDA